MVSPEGAEADAEAAEGAGVEATDVADTDVPPPAADVVEDVEAPAVLAPLEDTAAAPEAQTADREGEEDAPACGGAESQTAAEATLPPPPVADPGALLRPPPSSAPTTGTAGSRAAD